MKVNKMLLPVFIAITVAVTAAPALADKDDEHHDQGRVEEHHRDDRARHDRNEREHERDRNARNENGYAYENGYGYPSRHGVVCEPLSETRKEFLADRYGNSPQSSCREY